MAKDQGPMIHSLHHSIKQRQYLFLLWVPNRPNEITRCVFRISFQPDWRTDKKLFKQAKHGMLTQILVHRKAEQGFWSCFAERLNQKFSFVCGTGIPVLKQTWGIFFSSSGDRSSECLLPLPISKLIFLSRAPIESDAERLTTGLAASLLDVRDGLELLSKTSFCMHENKQQ